MFPAGKSADIDEMKEPRLAASPETGEDEAVGLAAKSRRL
jgi:hypothetical protein